jgi:stalled ribosome rescue protein Dom34
MKFTVIWIDREHASTFKISDGSMERKKFQATHTDHHTHRRDGLDYDREEPVLFAKVAAEIADSDRLLILGPGVAKHHFQTFLAEQRPQLSRKVLGVETVDHPSDAQIAAMAKRYFAALTG